ncbi:MULTISPECIES: helix-turn-helix domain-containing protein [unclassified Sphingomonas]|uniref:helix-turn-helix domain-containing protein n=1 Tax=unclassified Sphingomonas TaxID=196159 RepID=UPI000AAE9A33|nr:MULTISPECIES: helix-turn-helix transcriptional regulator [unclassified Sphingomonas]
MTAGTHSVPATLSAREIGCLRLSALGIGDEEISHELRISRWTVRFHLQNACRKLLATNRRHAIYMAAKRSII